MNPHTLALFAQHTPQVQLIEERHEALWVGSVSHMRPLATEIELALGLAPHYEQWADTSLKYLTSAKPTILFVDELFGAGDTLHIPTGMSVDDARDFSGLVIYAARKIYPALPIIAMHTGMLDRSGCFRAYKEGKIKMPLHYQEVGANVVLDKSDRNIMETISRETKTLLGSTHAPARKRVSI